MNTYPVKAAIATASGLLVWVVFEYDPLEPINVFDGLPSYILVGFLFAAGVLVPNLRRGSNYALRIVGLTIVSAISFYMAIQVSGELSGLGAPRDSVKAMVGASLVGAAIALGGAFFVAPLKRPQALLMLGVVAAVLGGLVFVYLPTLALGFATWHVLMTTAVHFSKAGAG